MSRLLTFTEQLILLTLDLPTDIITISIGPRQGEGWNTLQASLLEPLSQAQVLEFL